MTRPIKVGDVCAVGVGFYKEPPIVVVTEITDKKWEHTGGFTGFKSIPFTHATAGQMRNFIKNTLLNPSHKEK